MWSMVPFYFMSVMLQTCGLTYLYFLISDLMVVGYSSHLLAQLTCVIFILSSPFFILGKQLYSIKGQPLGYSILFVIFNITILTSWVSLFFLVLCYSIVYMALFLLGIVYLTPLLVVMSKKISEEMKEALIQGVDYYGYWLKFSLWGKHNSHKIFTFMKISSTNKKYIPMCMTHVASSVFWEAHVLYSDIKDLMKWSTKQFQKETEKLMMHCPTNSLFVTSGMMEEIKTSIYNINNHLTMTSLQKYNKMSHMWLQTMVLMHVKEQTEYQKEVNLKLFKKLYKKEPMMTL